jgi:hypothetical protein
VNLIELVKRKEFWMLTLSLRMKRFVKVNELQRLERNVIVNEEMTQKRCGRRDGKVEMRKKK